MRETLTTARLTLRRFTPGDTARVVEIQSNWDVTRMLRMAAYPPTFQDIGAWLVEHQAEWAAGTGYRFAVTLGGQVIGACDVDEIEGGKGDLGYWYDEAHWGQGYAFEAAVAVRDFAFGDLGLDLLTSGRVDDNPASGASWPSSGSVRPRSPPCRHAAARPISSTTAIGWSGIGWVKPRMKGAPPLGELSAKPTEGDFDPLAAPVTAATPEGFQSPSGASRQLPQKGST